MANLSKYITHGALVVASLGAALTLSQSAKAFIVSDFTTNPNFTFNLGDKIFSNFGITGSTVDPEDEITISFVGGVYQLNYNAANGANTALTTPGTLGYKVTIPDSYTNVFETVGTNAQGSTLPGRTFGKAVSEANLIVSPLVFTSTTGSTVFGNFNPGIKVINVTSAWSLDAPLSFINGFSDQYVQLPQDPDPVEVPEPSAVLGLISLGLAGLLSRTVSKSLGN